MEERFWMSMLDTLKDISSYLEKQDAFQERAKIGAPPKITENPKPIKGAEMPAGFKPADGKLMKEFVPLEEARDRDTRELEGKDETFLKEDEELEEDTEDLEEEPSEETVEETPEYAREESEDLEELKSLLKDIRNALSKQTNVADVVKSELKKALPNVIKGETDKMLRKMGFVPTRPDVQRIDVEKSRGLDSIEEVKKSEDIKKSQDDKEAEIIKGIDNLSKKSWTELGELREKSGGFNPFTR